MLQTTHDLSRRRRSGQRLISLGTALALTGFASVTVLPARADPVVAAKGQTFTLHGAGYGHGWGMSQYGAYGAAKKGLTWKQILAFYYPGTTRTLQSTKATIKVWITADSDDDLRVMPAAGLRLSDSSDHSYALPSGSTYTAWRVKRSGSGYALSYRNVAGSWVTQKTALSTTTWAFSDSAEVVTVWVPGGARRQLRGTVSLVKRGSGGRTVNRLAMEDYVKSVVPAEMPASWLADAVRSQAVAARSYGARLQASSRARGYDVCDSTSCQVYRGLASTSGSRRTVYETANGNAAVKATSRTILSYRSAIVLTNFASSNGGASAQGDYPYLAPRLDPYDGVIRSQAWTKKISAGSIAKAWPAAGAVAKVQVTVRDGSGRWGGRVTTMKIIGTKRTVTVKGTTFASKFGLRSRLFTLGSSGSAATPPNPPRSVLSRKAFATFPRTYSAGSRADLLIVRANGDLVRYPTGSGKLGTPKTLARGFGTYSQVANAGDWNGDGHQDVVARTTKARLLLFRGTSSGALRAGVDMGLHANFVTIAGVGDLNGDGRPDLVAQTTTGNLWLYCGDGRTSRSRSTKIGAWPTRDWLRTPGDLNGDGKPDLLSRIGTRLYLHAGTATGFRHPVSLGTGWDDLSAITTIGDFDGDGTSDIVARTRSGRLNLYRGDGKGRLRAPVRLAGSFTGTRFAT